MSKPSFSFGIKKDQTKKFAPTKRKPTTFGDEDGSEDDSKVAGSDVPVLEITEIDGFDSTTPCFESENRSSRKPKVPSQAPSSARKPAGAMPTTLGDLSSGLDARRHATAAEALDASIYDYDGVYDSLKRAGQKAQEAAAAGGPDGAQQGPKYFASIQRAAEVRERDRLMAEEKRLKRERDAEGAEFADKEKFVTEAYKRQQAENRRLEEEEKRREEEEARKNRGKGMADFYKKMLTRDEEIHAEKMKAAKEAKDTASAGAPADDDASRTDADVAQEINEKGGNVVLNEDGEVVDKRQLLRGGLNISAKKKTELQQQKTRRGATGANDNGEFKSKGVFASGGKQAMRERQTRMLEAQLEETLKRSRQQEDEDREKVELVSKSRKTEADISSAKERYLARKRAAEEAKKNGLADGV